MDGIARPTACFQDVHRLPHRLDTLLMGLLYLMSQCEFAKRETLSDTQTHDRTRATWVKADCATHSATASQQS